MLRVRVWARVWARDWVWVRVSGLRIAVSG